MVCIPGPTCSREGVGGAGLGGGGGGGAMAMRAPHRSFPPIITLCVYLCVFQQYLNCVCLPLYVQVRFTLCVFTLVCLGHIYIVCAYLGVFRSYLPCVCVCVFVFTCIFTSVYSGHTYFMQGCTVALTSCT